MESQPVLTAFEIRVIIGVIGAIVMLLIFFLGRPKKPKQGRRTALQLDEAIDGGRIEPSLGDPGEDDELDPDAEPEQGELVMPVDDDVPIERFGSAHGEELPLPSMRAGDDERPPARKPAVPQRPSVDPVVVVKPAEPAGRAVPGKSDDSAPQPPSVATRSHVGSRPPGPIDRIVTLYVSARAGETFNGSDLVVAAEKAGMQFGDMNIFHRMAPGKVDKGPVFSMATMIKPGNFDMRHIGELHTPGITLFMTLPGPMSALDAWDTMLPTAQRIAELLDGVVLDEQRHILGRQRIAHLRDELRLWDRQQERNQIKPGW